MRRSRPLAAAFCLGGLVPTVGLAAQDQPDVRACIPPEGIAAQRTANSDNLFTMFQDGTVWSRPKKINEGQAVVFKVVATDSVTGANLRVERASPTRTELVIRTIGALEERVDDNGDTPQNVCARWFVESDFAPGEGVARLTQLVKRKDSAGKETESRETVREVKFLVHSLYTGALSAGPMISTHADMSFGVAKDSAGTERVIRTVESDSRVEYAVLYTPFFFGPKTVRSNRWVAPFVGAVITDPLDNLMAGLTIDVLDGFFLHAGFHGTKVEALDPASGVTVGSAFDGDAADLPITKRWSIKPFYSATIDLTAAVELFKALAKGTGGG